MLTLLFSTTLISKIAPTARTIGILHDGMYGGMKYRQILQETDCGFESVPTLHISKSAVVLSRVRHGYFSNFNNVALPYLRKQARKLPKSSGW